MVAEQCMVLLVVFVATYVIGDYVTIMIWVDLSSGNGSVQLSAVEIM